MVRDVPCAGAVAAPPARARAAALAARATANSFFMDSSSCKTHLSRGVRATLHGRRSVEDGNPPLVQVDRHAGAERHHLGRRAVRDELHTVEEDAVEDVVTAKLAPDDLGGPGGVP